MLYTLCPDKLLGWCIELSDDAREYINPRYLSLPVLGNMQANNGSANREEIIQRKPDIILLATVIESDTVEIADKIQASMNIPVVVLDYGLKILDKSYLFLGKLLKEEKRAEALAEYSKKTVKETEAISKTIPEKEVLSVYYAQGADGLKTAPMNSYHTEVIKLAGGRNVATVDVGPEGRLAVSMEQLLLWNPDVIIASYNMEGNGSYSKNTGIFSVISKGSKTWRNIKAVREGMVYTTPCAPFNWLDMPPSANRLIGIKWMGSLLYPKYFHNDIRLEASSFYQLFYHVKLTDKQLDKLLESALRVKR